MARPRVSETQRRDGAIRAARRMVSGGERPGYRLRADQDGSWAVVGLPGLLLAPMDRRTALRDAPAFIAAWLDVPANSFYLEADASR